MEKSENKNVLAIDIILSSLKNKDGTINEGKLKEFIQETVKLRQSSSEVYSNITKGLLSNWNYPAETVLSVVNNLQKDKVDKSEICEDILNLVQDEGTKQLILEYFGKIY